AIILSEYRLKNPIKTESQLLENGKDSYLTLNNDVLDVLTKINATPVWRNKGIDGFLNINNSLRPIPVKVQKQTETLEKAKYLLIKACQKNSYQRKVLISTQHTQQQSSLFDNKSSDKDLIILQGVEDYIQKQKIIAIND
nr:site-specific DNA-methyltransferase [Alphaproteobacteria bacterium]